MKTYFLCYVTLSIMMKLWYEKEKKKTIPEFMTEQKPYYRKEKKRIEPVQVVSMPQVNPKVVDINAYRKNREMAL
jgi:hypothetical protein